MLLDAGADVNAIELWGQQSALMWAAAQRQPAMIKLLIARGADVDARGAVRNWERKVIREPRPKDMNQGGFTPLLYAAREGCIECAKELVAGGADLDLPDPHRVTPLNMALMNLHFDFAAYLIEAGADIDKWDLYGRSPLYLAADMSTIPVMGNGAMVVLPSMDKLKAIDVARLLLDKGANVNAQLKRRPPYRNVPQDRGGDSILSMGATPLLRAARAGDTPMVRAAARARCARRSAEQSRRHAADGCGGRRIRLARHARPQSHRRGRAVDDARCCSMPAPTSRRECSWSRRAKRRRICSSSSSG